MLVEFAGDDHLPQHIPALQKFDLRVKFLFRDFVAHHDWSDLFRAYHRVLALPVHEEFSRGAILRGLEYSHQHRTQQNTEKAEHGDSLVAEANGHQVT